MRKNNPAQIVVAAVLVMTACGGAAADHETLGDQAYVERRFGEALAEFQLGLRQGVSSGGLRLKAGMAALNARDLVEAAVQFEALAVEHEDQLAIAADGLGRVARAASAEGNGPALQAALQGLRSVVPGRALGTFANELAVGLGENSSPAEAIAILPFAAAAAPDAGLQDSLMYTYGIALAEVNRCEEALPVFESLVRRGRKPAVQSGARGRATTCALVLGRRDLFQGSQEDAEAWFCRAIEIGNNNYAARAAHLGLGDIWFSRGDYLGARTAYAQAMVGVSQSDSLYQRARRARDRIRGLDLLQPPEQTPRRRC